MNYYFDALKKYAEFSGRAGRAEYWYFVLFNFIAAGVLSAVDAVIGTTGVLGGIYALGVLIPSLAILWRRLHDTGRSGAWVLILLVPLAGPIVLLVFLVQDTTKEDNQWGTITQGSHLIAA